MNDLEVYNKLEAIENAPHFSLLFEDESEQAQKIARHKAWLQSIRHERPNTGHWSLSLAYRVTAYLQVRLGNLLLALGTYLVAGYSVFKVPKKFFFSTF